MDRQTWPIYYVFNKKLNTSECLNLVYRTKLMNTGMHFIQQRENFFTSAK